MRSVVMEREGGGGGGMFSILGLWLAFSLAVGAGERFEDPKKRGYGSVCGEVRTLGKREGRRNSSFIEHVLHEFTDKLLRGSRDRSPDSWRSFADTLQPEEIVIHRQLHSTPEGRR